MELNAQQREAVMHTQGALLLLAGPGSGKTRVITYRIAHIVTEGLAPPSAILAVTFTNKAAGEMRERALKLLGPIDSSPIIRTFHAFCMQLLRRDGAPLAKIRSGFTPKFQIYDKSDQEVVIKECYRGLNLKEKYFMSHGDVATLISRAKTRGRTPADFLKEAGDNQDDPTFAKVFEAYEVAMRRANALDFDDLLGETVRLLRGEDSVRRAWNKRLEYIMVDEFQDTNGAQYELIRLLTQRHDNVCVVGDDDQGIYSWRGATAANISYFTRDYPEAKIIRLEQNYRSTQNIVAASRGVIEKNQFRVRKELWTELPPGDLIGVYEASNADEEALFIVSCITRYQASSSADRAAVLYRSNNQSRKIEQAMRRYGIKYKVVGASFFQRREIKDVVAYLKLATGNLDSVSLLRVINQPPRAIGPKAIETIRQFARENGLDLWGAIEQITSRKLYVFRNVIANLSAAAATSSLPALLEFIVEETGYKRMLETARDKDAEDGPRLDNVQELIDMAREAAERGETVDDFLEYMALQGDADAYDENAKISLMTLHSAKGLEFPLVIICGMEEGLFPSSRSEKSRELREEERRVFYVGMTRAKGWLILTRAQFRVPFGVTEPSSFLDELPEHLVIELDRPRAIGG
jgi:DNA helicase-2/ATP-dependent DNA helicase PcrA